MGLSKGILKTMIKRHLQRFGFALSGIWYALKNDFSYQWQVIGGLIFLPIFCYFMGPLTQLEIIALGLSYTLILITELQNSSFEAALDRLHPERHTDIGRSKDMAAGAVLTAGLFFLFVVLFITFS